MAVARLWGLEVSSFYFGRMSVYRGIVLGMNCVSGGGGGLPHPIPLPAPVMRITLSLKLYDILLLNWLSQVSWNGAIK